MARHAETVSFLYQESGDARTALFWLDRSAFWSGTIGWRYMIAETIGRRRYR